MALYIDNVIIPPFYDIYFDNQSVNKIVTDGVVVWEKDTRTIKAFVMCFMNHTVSLDVSPKDLPYPCTVSNFINYLNGASLDKNLNGTHPGIYNNDKLTIHVGSAFHGIAKTQDESELKAKMLNSSSDIMIYTDSPDTYIIEPGQTVCFIDIVRGYHEHGENAAISVNLGSNDVEATADGARYLFVPEDTSQYRITIVSDNIDIGKEIPDGSEYLTEKTFVYDASEANHIIILLATSDFSPSQNGVLLIEKLT